MTFVCYPKCTTCQKAQKWLDEKGVSYEVRHIAEQNPNVEELRAWIEKSGLDTKKFFNTCGLRYKALGLKDKLQDMTVDAQIDLLASDGMLVKRPLLVMDDAVLVGFREGEWAQKLKEKR